MAADTIYETLVEAAERDRRGRLGVMVEAGSRALAVEKQQGHGVYHCCQCDN